DEARSDAAARDGKATMDAIRIVVARMTAALDAARAQLRHRTLVRSNWATGTAMASALLACLLVGAATILLRRESAGRLLLAEQSGARARDAGALATWEWDWRTGGVTASPAARRLLRLPPDKDLRTADLFAALHPDDNAEAALRPIGAQDSCEWE